MAKKKQTILQTKLFVIAGLIIASLFIIISAGKYNFRSPQQLKSEAYQLYQSSEYGFGIEYPNNWEVKSDTRVFKNGDVVAFRKTGPAQKTQTELTNGVQVVVAKPFQITTDLATWTKEYFGKQATYSKFTLAKYPYEAVEDCSDLGCITYYYTLVNNRVYGIAVFSQGPDSEKAAYENAIIYMIKSLQFNDSEGNIVTEESAISKVKSLPEVVDYLKRVPNSLVEVNGKEDNVYMVQVYEFKNGHTATFNWYEVNKTTGDVEKQF